MHQPLVKTCILTVSLVAVVFVVYDVFRNRVAVPNSMRITKSFGRWKSRESFDETDQMRKLVLEGMLSGTRLETMSIMTSLPSNVVLIDLAYMLSCSGCEKGNFSRRSFLGAGNLNEFIDKDIVLFALKVATKKDISHLKEHLLKRNVSLTIEQDGNILLLTSKPMIRIVVLLESSNHDFFTFNLKNVSRMIMSFKTEHTNVGNAWFLKPRDCSRFAWMMLRSRLISCDVQIADTYRKENPERFAVKPKIGPEFIFHMAKLRDWAVERGATLMLSCGTLLGWLRECGIIYHTHDVDFMLFSEEYYEGMRDDIKQADFMALYHQFNLPENLLEYNVRINGKPADMFFVYNNETASWIGGLSGKQKYRFVYPIIDRVCTTQLLDHLMYVPCNARDVVATDYGKDWSKPFNGTFVWYASPFSAEEAGTYTDDEFKTAFITF